MPGKHAPPEVRFWRHVSISDACWVWTGSTTDKGYGKFKQESGRPPVRAHRYSWEMASGKPVPSGALVRHSCDNPPCVRPDHLSVGSDADNSADMIERGRSPYQNPDSAEMKAFVEMVRKLTDEQIEDGRRRVAGGESQRSVARDFGVDHSTIWRLIHRVNWATHP